MHIAVCKLLSRYNYYEYEGCDKDGWPHYVVLADLPELTEKERERLLRMSIFAYFDS